FRDRGEVHGHAVGHPADPAGMDADILGADGDGYAVALEVVRQVDRGEIEAIAAEEAGVAPGVELEDFGGKDIRESEKTRSFETGRVFDDVARGAALDDAAGFEQDGVGDGGVAEVEIGGDDEDGGGEDFGDAIELGFVYATVVDEEELGFGKKGAGDLAAERLAPKKGVGLGVDHRGEIEAVGHLGDPFVALETGPVEGSEHEVLLDG